MYTYISNIYRFVGVTGIIIIYRSSSSSTGSIKTVAQYAYMCIVLRSFSRGAFILFLLKRSPPTRLE